MEGLTPGMAGEASLTVVVGNTASEFGSGTVPVLATPMLVALMENAALNALAGRLAEGQTTVGTRVEVAHVAPTPLGMTVTARAQLEEVDGRKLVFQVTATDEAGPVGHGRHERYVVNRDRFMSRVEERRVVGAGR